MVNYFILFLFTQLSIILLACLIHVVDQIHIIHIVGVSTKKLFLYCICHFDWDKTRKDSGLWFG